MYFIYIWLKISSKLYFFLKEKQLNILCEEIIPKVSNSGIKDKIDKQIHIHLIYLFFLKTEPHTRHRFPRLQRNKRAPPWFCKTLEPETEIAARGFSSPLSQKVQIFSVAMGGSRAQLNKPHKSRFSTKSSRNLHKTSLKGSSLSISLTFLCDLYCFYRILKRSRVVFLVC